MKFRPIIVDENQQELTSYDAHDFPVFIDEQQPFHKGCKNIPHWHNEVQFVLATKGTVGFRTHGEYYFCNENEGVFFNSRIMHEVITSEDEHSIYISVNFDPSLIVGETGTSIYRDYVMPVLRNPNMQTLKIEKTGWGIKAGEIIHELGIVNDEQQHGFELYIKALLCQLWHLLLTTHREIIDETAAISSSDKERMKTLQSFIYKNYMDNITLTDIAKAGHISRGECCRIFKRVQQISPIAFLTKYRIEQSCKLLTYTDLSITEVAQQTGFGTSSYFTERFKAELGTTPLKFRKQYTGKLD